MTELWIAGKHIPCPFDGQVCRGEWELLGVFDSRDKAIAACTDDCHFIGPAILNRREPDESQSWDGFYYPLLENPDGTPLNDRDGKMNKDTSIIPEGLYCYTRVSLDFMGLGTLAFPCPYWDKIEGKPEQSCGYCHYLEKGDGEDGCFLLWDQVKECGINTEDD